MWKWIPGQARDDRKKYMPQQDEKLHNLRHTAAHILAHAVLNLYGSKVKFGIGPVIESGFYYDFLFPKAISDADLLRIEKEMRRLVNQNLKMAKEEYSLAEAKKIMKDQPFKLELLREIEKGERAKVKGAGRGKISFYKIGNFLDLCKGGHVKSSKEIPADAFKLSHLAGAYWRGDEKNPMLTRIYGLAFANKKELDEYLVMLEEAKKRDHKKLGIELDLFTFSDLVGAGLPLWTPKGTIIRDLLDDYVWQLRKARGYQKVEIPHITKKELYETSGHWDKFKNELYRIKTREGREFAMKPMNCPHHTQIYARKQWSYRELPQRYANTTMVYRDEQTGELSGLSRVRSITQDDAHVFCRQNKLQGEILKIWDIIDEFYSSFGFTLEVRLSRSDPNHREKYLGVRRGWDGSESILKKVMISKQAWREENDRIGEAAFYGPKIDFMAKDSLGRQWQVATIQLDLNMPERFDLSCVNEKGEKERIVMVHAAIMGSIERFMAVIIEHFAGAFPTWLSPVQAAVLPVSDQFNEYAKAVTEDLETLDIRAFLDDRSESVGKKIRESEKAKIPYMLVIGQREQAEKTVSVRGRGEKDLGTIPLKRFVERIRKEIESKSV